MSSCGTGDTHCCWLGTYGKCKYVREVDKPPFKWECQLRAENGSWETTHTDSRYIEDVQPKLRASNIAVDCGDWPTKVPGARCGDCGYGVD